MALFTNIIHSFQYHHNFWSIFQRPISKPVNISVFRGFHIQQTTHNAVSDLSSWWLLMSFDDFWWFLWLLMIFMTFAEQDSLRQPTFESSTICSCWAPWSPDDVSLWFFRSPSMIFHHHIHLNNCYHQNNRLTDFQLMPVITINIFITTILTITIIAIFSDFWTRTTSAVFPKGFSRTSKIWSYCEFKSKREK